MSFERSTPTRPERITSIEEAKDFDGLFAALDRLGSLRGSQGDYSSEDLKNIINEVCGNTKGIEYVTRTGGLRDKVVSLMEKGAGSGETVASIPKVGDEITLTKRSLKGDTRSAIGAGEVIEGALTQEIRLGAPVFFGTGRTSNVQGMRIENGKIVVETQTSVYEIELKKK